MILVGSGDCSISAVGHRWVVRQPGAVVWKCDGPGSPFRESARGPPQAGPFGRVDEVAVGARAAAADGILALRRPRASIARQAP